MSKSRFVRPSFSSLLFYIMNFLNIVDPLRMLKKINNNLTVGMDSG